MKAASNKSGRVKMAREGSVNILPAQTAVTAPKRMTKKGTVKQAATAPPNKPLNRSLVAARTTKQDEFYTQLSDIEKELRHYTKHFKNKTVVPTVTTPQLAISFTIFRTTSRSLGSKS